MESVALKCLRVYFLPPSFIRFQSDISGKGAHRKLLHVGVIVGHCSNAGVHPPFEIKAPPGKGVLTTIVE